MGKTPEWNDVFTTDYFGQMKGRVNIYDKDRLSARDIVGFGYFSHRSGFGTFQEGTRTAPACETEAQKASSTTPCQNTSIGTITAQQRAYQY